MTRVPDRGTRRAAGVVTWESVPSRTSSTSADRMASTSHAAAPRLLGRQPHCDAIDRLVRDLHAGSSRALVLRGEAGIGKTALLDHLVTRAASSRIERAAGVESEMELPFAGLHQLCARLIDRMDALPEPQQDALATTFGLSRGAVPDRLLVGLAVLGLLTAVAAAQPLLCVIDDAQWLDRASLQVLAFVARRLGEESVGLVFAIREPNAPEELAGLPELPVEGLPDPDARALLDSVVPGRLDVRVRDRIVAETGGNPLALVELPRGLTVAELEFGFGLPAALPMAGRIEEGFLRQLQLLSSDARQLLLLAAVEPTGDAALLRRAAEHLELPDDAGDEATRAGFVRIRGGVRFKHPLVRSAVVRGATARHVQVAHGALAAVTDPELDPDRRAWHRAYACAGPDEVVAEELEHAASRARRRGGMAASAAFLARASELTPEPSRRGSRALAAATGKLFASDTAGSFELLAAAELCPLSDFERAQAARLRASLPSMIGYDAAPVMLYEAARGLEPLDHEAARGAFLGALSLRLFLGRLDCPMGVEEMAAGCRAAPSPARRPHVVDALLDGLAARFTTGYGDAVARLRAAIDLAVDDRDGDSMAEWVWFAGPSALELWDDTRSELLTAHLITLCRTSGTLKSLPTALDHRASVELLMGSFAEAAALIREADALDEATGSAPQRSAGIELAAWRGNESRTHELGIETTRFWGARGWGRTIGIAEHAKALLYNGLGRYDDALAAATRACEFDDFGLYGSSLVELVEAAVRGNDVALAEDAAQQIDARAAATATDWALGLRARSQALLSVGDTAEAWYREAIDRLESTRMVVDVARAQLLYGEWLRRAQRRRDARDQLRAAHTTFDRIGAAGFAERARVELAATGETVRRRSVETQVVLTPQEAQIARLATTGRTNPEIGSQLFISPRTVEYHLGKVFTKLGIASRRELRTALAEAGGSADLV
jgi:DNA-binding CsgD family transcriptional regulator/tetratricopeptide (TPR) repeat protein